MILIYKNSAFFASLKVSRLNLKSIDMQSWALLIPRIATFIIMAKENIWIIKKYLTYHFVSIEYHRGCL